MPFWNRRSDEKEVERSYIEQTANEALRDLAGRENPRSSIAVEMMLRWLWHLDSPKIRALHRVLGAPGLDQELYDGFLNALTQNIGDEPALQPFPVVAARLSDLLTGFLIMERTPLGLRDHFISSRVVIENGVAMVGRLQAVEAHGAICRLLSAANFNLQRRVWNSASNHLPAGMETAARELARLTTECLLALPPDGIPEFWSRLKAVRTARDLRPVAARMRDRRAVPYLLEALPCLEEDGQSDVILTLGHIKDPRAIPALQELAADPSKLIAPIAAHALAEILRTSQDDAAQLLRPTDSGHGDNVGDTLLRAAAPSPSPATPADQLLRADQSAHGEAGTPPEAADRHE